MRSNVCRIGLGAAAMAVVCTSAVLWAQPGKEPPAPPADKPAMTDEQMAEHEQAAAKSKEHEALAKMAGAYTWAAKFEMGPEMPAMEETGTSKFAMILDGRFLVEDDEGTMAGMPFTSHKMWGYNGASGKYEAVWTYTGSTAMMHLSGTSADAGKTVMFEATYDAGKAAAEKFTITLRRHDADRFEIELLGKNPDGSEGGRLTTVYTRKK